MKTLEPQLLRVEAADDLPVLWTTIERLNLPTLLDRHYPATPHWKGPLTPGEVLCIWLLFILSEGDHRLNQVQIWVARHQGILSSFLGKTILPVNAHDDRLAELLTRLAESQPFAQTERELNQQTLRVYQLPDQIIRIDTTTVNTSNDVLSEDGMVQFGHSKDDPSQPQIKIATATLDPLGMPLATAVVAGNCADDPLYIPTIKSVHEAFGVGGRTYIGDCKMGSLATRAFVASGSDFYLCPLSEIQLSRAERTRLLQPVWDGTQALESANREAEQDASGEKLAEGFSIDVELCAMVGEKKVHWTERRWLVRSLSYSRTQASALDRRLAKAEKELKELTIARQGKKKRGYAELQQAARAIVVREEVEGLLSYTIEARMRTKKVRGYKGAGSRKQEDLWCEIEVQRKEEQIRSRKQELGWQVYGTNHQQMNLSQVVLAYRGQYSQEKSWSRLKGRPLGLSPMYLQDEQRIVGLVHLLSLALRLLVLVESVVRENLRRQKTPLRGIYAGQPGRKTMTPSAELLLRAMKGISVSVVEIAGEIHALLSPLTQVQQRLLVLWDLPPDLYTKVLRGFQKPIESLSEP